MKHSDQIFERIHRDDRRQDVIVLESGMVSQREFLEWSVSFSGMVQEELEVFSEFKLAHAIECLSAASAEIDELLRSIVIQQEDFLHAQLDSSLATRRV